MSHPGSRKQNRSLHTCAQDVQITHTTNNMVNRYNISLNYKLEAAHRSSPLPPAVGSEAYDLD
jgi:hypothetical protein